MNAFQTDYISLIRASLTEELPAVSPDFDYTRAFHHAQEFGLTALLYRGARKVAAFASYPDKMAVIRQSCHEAAVHRRQMKAIDEISRGFQEEGLDYCLLKGAELKKLYPSPELRPMSDIDILIRGEEYDRIKSIMKKCGFAFYKETGHEIIWVWPDGTEVELHKCLFDPWHAKYWSYFSDIWDRVSGHYLEPELSYLFQVVHLSKHTYLGSAPMKHFLDLYIYRKAHPEMDTAFIEGELEKLQLAEFHRLVLKVIHIWFYGGQSDETADLLIDMTFYSRDKRSGEVLNSHLMEHSKKGSKSKLGILISRLMLPRKEMAVLFPVLEKHPYLLPLCWMARTVQLLTTRHERGRQRIRELSALDIGEYRQYRQRMKAFGLEDRFTDEPQ